MWVDTRTRGWYDVCEIGSFLYQGFLYGPKRGVPHRSKLKIAHDRREIARRYLSGAHQVDIGASLGLTQQTISLELAAIKKEWMASGVRDFDEAKSLELAKIDLLEQT